MIFGLTIDNAFDIKQAVTFIPKLAVKPLCRVVIDNGVDLEEYTEPVKKLLTVSDVMIQIQDSFGDDKLHDRALMEKAVKLVKLFPQVKDFEIANEINGNWCHPNATKRMAALSDTLQGKRRWVTLFMQDGMMDWWTLNAVKCEYLVVSHYPEHLNDMTQDWERIFTKLGRTPGVEGVGFAEFGVQNLKYKKNALTEMIEFYYSKIEVPKYIGGGFLWDFQSVIKGKNIMSSLKKMSELYK